MTEEEKKVPPPSQEQIICSLLMAVPYNNGGKITYPTIPKEMHGADLSISWSFSEEGKMVTLQLNRIIPFNIPVLDEKPLDPNPDTE